MSESYARKLREFMEERAQERLQSQRRVAELEAVLGAYGAGRKPAFGSPLIGSTDRPANPAPAAAAGGGGSAHQRFGTPPRRASGVRLSAADLGSADGGSYTQRLAELAAEREHEEQRHREELQKLRQTQTHISRNLTDVTEAAAAYANGDADCNGMDDGSAQAVPIGAGASAACAAAAAAASSAAAAAAAAAASSSNAATGSNGQHAVPAASAVADAADAAARLRALRTEQVREQQRVRVSELQRHISVLQAGGVTSQLGKMRLARLQEELTALTKAVQEPSRQSPAPPPPQVEEPRASPAAPSYVAGSGTPHTASSSLMPPPPPKPPLAPNPPPPPPTAGAAHAMAGGGTPYTPEQRLPSTAAHDGGGYDHLVDSAGPRDAAYNPHLDSAAPPNRHGDDAPEPVPYAMPHVERYDGPAGGEVYDASMGGVRAPPLPPPPAPPAATEWWAGGSDARRANDALRDSLVAAGACGDGSGHEFANAAAAWRAERAKLVEGHAALARRLAAEVEARETVSARLVASEARAGLVDAAERTAEAAQTRSDALQQRVDMLVGSMETRDGEMKELNGKLLRSNEKVNAIEAESAQAATAMRERLEHAEGEHAGAQKKADAAAESVERLTTEQASLQEALRTARAELCAATSRADAAEEEAAEHEASLKRQADSDAAKLSATHTSIRDLEERLRAQQQQISSSAEVEAARGVSTAAMEERLADVEGHASHLAKELGTARGNLQAAQRELEDGAGALAAMEARARMAEDAAEANAAEVGRMHAATGLKDIDLAALKARLAEATADATANASALAAARAEAEDERRRAEAAVVSKSTGEGEWRSRAEAATTLAEKLEREMEEQAARSVPCPSASRPAHSAPLGGAPTAYVRSLPLSWCAQRPGACAGDG